MKKNGLVRVELAHEYLYYFVFQYFFVIVATEIPNYNGSLDTAW